MKPAEDALSAARSDAEYRTRRYRFDNHILDRVRQCRFPDNYHGLRELAEDWAVILLSLWLSLLAWKHLPFGASVAVYFIAIFLIGGRQRALADILHQQAHRTLTKNRSLGIVCGTAFSGYLVFQSLSGYRFSHILRHHAFLGHPALDPDYRQYQLWGICGPNRTAAAVRRHLLRSLSPQSTLNYLRYLVVYRIVPRGESPVERALRLAFLAVLTFLVCYYQRTTVVAAYWLIPLVTTQTWIGAFLELLEHYPMIEAERGLDISMSRNRRCNRLECFMLGVQQYDGYHLVHHLFPFIPSWRLEEAHRILMDDELYRSLNQTYGLKSIIQTLLKPAENTPSVVGSPA